MIDFNAWVAQPSIVQSQWQQRAMVQWARILDKPFDIELLRENVKLPVQTIRIEYDDTFSELNSELGSAGFRRVILFGVRGHPEIDDFDVLAWDTFRMDEQEFTVRTVNRTLIGQIQAHCEAVG